MELKKKDPTNIKTYRIVIIGFCLICLFTSFLCYQYYRQLQTTIKEESSGYLQEISNRIGSNINRTINNSYAVLNALSTYVEDEHAHTFSDVNAIVQKQKEDWSYESIMFSDVSGNVYTSDGKSMQLTGDVYFQDSVVKMERAMSMYQVVNGKECVLFSAPLENVSISGINMQGIISSYDASSFDKILSMTSFSDQSYSHIIGKDGSIIVRSASGAAKEMGYNILSAIEESKIDSDSSFDILKSDISKNKSGQIGFTIDGDRYYMVYTPIEPDDWYLLTFVPASVVNAKTDILLRMTILLTFVVVTVFCILILAIIIIFRRNRKGLERIAFVDEITGGNTIQKFYDEASGILSHRENKHYALVYTNIVKFKVMNEQFGRNTCDIILRELYGFISKCLGEEECMGRMAGDNFCILLEYENDQEIVEKFKVWFTEAEQYVISYNPAWVLPVVEFGIYMIENDELTFNQMIDRAQLALKESTLFINNKMRYAIYDDNVRRKLFREKQLEDMMEDAMKSHEFQVYLQPKYNVQDETIGGAEALTRWKSSIEGMIFPDEFIPLFEKNGFIIQLDLWVFEEVCKHVRKWIDNGLEPMTISINCSKVHLKDSDFLREYRRIASEYNIPRGLLEIELTESIVMEDEEGLTDVINQIHEAGFSCSMDDFGSGYSSLNLVQTIPVDTLKIDKIFFRKDGTDEKRMEAVVSNIISMAKALDMTTVAEGVEYPDQVKMLKKYDCDLIQGYVFAKPMPIVDFEKLAFPEMK